MTPVRGTRPVNEELGTYVTFKESHPEKRCYRCGDAMHSFQAYHHPRFTPDGRTQEGRVVCERCYGLANKR